ncbi:MAG: EAL domain-containing protein [Deltaproteobacteria bacterium]|nr:EAL domain-containing protein [Deltaproteobacteria bacterium]
MIKRSLSVNILAYAVSIIVIGFGALTYMVIVQQERSLLREVEKTVKFMAQPILHAIQEDMMAGRADMARYLIDAVKEAKNAERVQVIRDNGVEEAFRDFKTLRKVEEVYGELEPEWTKTHEDVENNVAEGVYTPEFKEAFRLFNEGRLESVSYFEKERDAQLFTYLVPIVAREGCKRCHAEGGSIRGVLMISASLEDMYAILAHRRIQWGLYGLSVTLGVVVLLIFFIRRITRPLHEVAEAAGQIAQGNYSVNIPVKTGDEIGLLSESFNSMARELDAKIRDIRKLSMIIEHSVDIVFITNTKGTIEYVNPMFEKVTGWSKEEAVGQNPRILSSGETTKADYQGLWDTISAGKTWRGIFKNKKKSGDFYWGIGVITPIKNEKGEITNFLAVQEDITENKKAEERSEYLANSDVLTGLLNRERLIELLNEWFRGCIDKQGILFLIGIDDFKSINDTYGHGVGDSLLQRVARLIQSSLIEMNLPQMEDPGEILSGRMGGDEFAVFLPGLDVNKGIEVCERLRKDIEGSRPMAFDAHITASIGIVSYPEHGRTTTELFKKSDAALSRAKEMGRNRCHLYSPEDKVLENIHLRLTEKTRILKALEEDRFVPWFQPILSLKDGMITHYEALARMRDEDGTILPPSAFIDTAERFGLIGAIDRIITEKTMRVQAEMGRQKKYVSFGMNLSGKDLGDEDILLFLQSKIKETGADPSHLIFEITETAAVYDLDRAVKFITELKSMGCRFSLDDFGVGFTSLVYLREMQVDYIKIDGAFVKKLPESPNDQLFVKAIVDVARGMGIKTVAEFVESEKTLNLLKEYGVDYAQGYFIGKPGPKLLKDR